MTSGELRVELQRALGAAFILEGELGGGLMSLVFLATDVRLGRRVVIKVLHPACAAVLSMARFERETLVAARLQHPHILPVHAAGQVAGLPYYTMPYVDGESLRARLGREGPLPIREALRILRELAEALGHAHEHGVVHRDLKPENVLLSSGHATITDFGVAKALATAASERPMSVHGDPSAFSTTVGLAIGTPGYMAPEQALGDLAVDHRADLYALGVIAYEMLAGAHPFAGRSARGLVAAHISVSPAPLVRHRPEVPPALDSLVLRLMAKQPGDRPPDAAEVARELDAMGTARRLRGVSAVAALRGRLRAAWRRWVVPPAR